MDHLTRTVLGVFTLVGVGVGAASEAGAQPVASRVGFPQGLGFHGSLGIGSEWLSLADHGFSGSGQLSTTHAPATFDARGRDIGLRFPSFSPLALTLGMQWQWFLLGVVFDYAVTGPGNLSTPENGALGAQVSPGNASMFLVGGEVGAMVTLRPWAFQFTVQAGYRELTVPITAYAGTTCYTASNPRTGAPGAMYPCSNTADGGGGFLRPRVKVELIPANWHVGVGVYVAGQVYPDLGIGAGAEVTVHLIDLWGTAP